MTTRRRTSRNVALTAAFLALAAGGGAACDAPSGDDDTYDTSYRSGPGYEADTSDDDGPPDDGGAYVADGGAYVADGEESSDEVFYCADEDGEIVDEDLCEDDGGGTTSYYLWHSSTYSRGLRPGTVLDGGESFPAGDRRIRRAYKLPATGKVVNGTIKTNVVGRGSGGSGLSGGG